MSLPPAHQPRALARDRGVHDRDGGNHRERHAQLGARGDRIGDPRRRAAHRDGRPGRVFRGRPGRAQPGAARIPAQRRPGARERDPLLRLRRRAALPVAAFGLPGRTRGTGVVHAAGRTRAPGVAPGAAGRRDRGHARSVALHPRSLGGADGVCVAGARIPGRHQSSGVLARRPLAQAAAEDPGGARGDGARPAPHPAAGLPAGGVRLDQRRIQPHGASARGESRAEPAARPGGAAVERRDHHPRPGGTHLVLQRGRGAAARFRPGRARRQPGAAHRCPPVDMASSPTPSSPSSGASTSSCSRRSV